jgi:hypothetical protein
MPKNKASCSLQFWLRSYDKKLHAAAEEACLLGLLNPGRFGGITFLYPEDKPLRKKLVSALEENDMEGVNMFRSMIITDYLPSPEDWLRKKDDIPNRLGFKVNVASGDRQSITLDNGAVIKPLSKFKARSDRQNMSVWSYKGKPMPLTGEKAERKYTKQGAPNFVKKKGGFFKSKITPFGLAKSCEGKAQAYMKAGKYSDCNVHLDVLCSYLCYLEKKYPDKLEEISTMLAYCPEATFYNVFEPYIKGSSPANFEEWMDTTKGVCLEFSSADKYCEFVKNAIENSDILRVNTGDLRVNLLDNRFPQTLRQDLCALYESEDFSMYSPLYAESSMRKAMHDETRFMMNDKLIAVLSSGDSYALRDMFFEIECMQRGGYVKGPYIMTKYIDSENDTSDIAGFYSTAVAFLLSDCFVYAPYEESAPDQVLAIAHDENGGEPRNVVLSDVKFQDFMGDNVLLTTQDFAKKRMEKISAYQNSNGDNAQNAFAQILNLLDESSKITPQLKEAISRINGLNNV